MTSKKQSFESKKSEMYKEIANLCDNLPVARYLKNEAKEALKYFHVHKLTNIRKNFSEFSEYLLLLNDENCRKIDEFVAGKEHKKDLNNSLSYFYYVDDNMDSNKKEALLQKIETNSYETITLMQSLKWYLILTIDEFCNASDTRVDIIRYELGKKKAKCKK